MRRATRIWLPPQTAEIHRVKRRMRPVQIAVLAIMALALMVLGISFSYLLEKAPILVATIPLVLYVAFWGTALACFLGFFGALGLLSPRPVFNVPAKLYVSLGQGVPVIVVLFLLYFGLPHLHSSLLLTSIQAGILGLGITNGAYLSEVFRVSIQSVHYGQTEAARAIGMTAVKAFRRVIFPQAARNAIPPTANYYIFILKDSTLVSFIGVAELFSKAQSIGQRDFRILEMLILAGSIYWCLTVALNWFQARLESRIGVAYARD